MTGTYRAEQFINIMASEAGHEIELKMVVRFKAHKGSPATQVDPAEPPSVEINDIHFFRMHNGKPSPAPFRRLSWLSAEFAESEVFTDWLLSEASETMIAEQEAAAEMRREMIKEDRL